MKTKTIDPIDVIRLFGVSHVTAVLFGGDRAMCCDEAIIAEEGEKPVGVVSLSMIGEGGNGPAIVGLYVVQEYRKQGIATMLARMAINRLAQLGAKRIKVDAISKGGAAVMKKFSDPRLDVTEFASMFAMDF